MTTAGWNPDFLDMLTALRGADVRFMVVGAHALAVHGVPRATQDLDIWVEASRDNAERVVAALGAFGAPLAAHGITADDFTREGTVYQLGLPPSRIDLLTRISGVSFADAWPTRAVAEVDGVDVPFIGSSAQLVNKEATGRPKDLVDAQLLRARLQPDASE